MASVGTLNLSVSLFSVDLVNHNQTRPKGPWDQSVTSSVTSCLPTRPPSFREDKASPFIAAAAKHVCVFLKWQEGTLWATDVDSTVRREATGLMVPTANPEQHCIVAAWESVSDGWLTTQVHVWHIHSGDLLLVTEKDRIHVLSTVLGWAPRRLFSWLTRRRAIKGIMSQKESGALDTFKQDTQSNVVSCYSCRNSNAAGKWALL